MDKSDYFWVETQRAWKMFEFLHNAYVPDARRLQKLLRCMTGCKLSFDHAGRVSRLRPDIKSTVITSERYRDEIRKSIDEFTPFDFDEL